MAPTTCFPAAAARHPPGLGAASARAHLLAGAQLAARAPGRQCASHVPARAAPAAAAASAAAAAPAAAPPRPAGTKRQAFPFVRLAGQEDMKLSLLLNVVDPSIGGVLVMGDRGTGKSVGVRALVDLLPPIDVVPGDPFNSSPTDPRLMGPDVLARARAGEALPSAPAPTPLVELPLGATEDRVCGTIDVERALSEGVRAYEPGLLARANRGILYVDEVNLLDDGLVDVVLDAAAGGQNTVEREGVSVVHPARFIMIGSGNPAEGELRPQLLDRFGLSVGVGTLPGADERTAMVLNRGAYDADAARFCAAAEPEQAALRERLAAARALLPRVELPRALRLRISEVCSLLGIDGVRGDIVLNRAAAAHAALEGRAAAAWDDVLRVAPLCLNHRLRKDPLDPIDGGTKVALALQRVANPRAAQAEAEQKAAAEEAAKAGGAAARSGMKAGAWKGLP